MACLAKAFRRQAVLAGACAALMLASKETAVLHFLSRWRSPHRLLEVESPKKISWRFVAGRAVLAAAVSFLLLSVLLFTWFGSNWKALAALLRQYPTFLHVRTAKGTKNPSGIYLRCNRWLVRWNDLHPRLHRLFQTVRKRSPSAYAFWRSMLLHRRHLQLDFIQDAVAGLIFGCYRLVRCLAFGIALAHAGDVSALRRPIAPPCILVGAVALH